MDIPVGRGGNINPGNQYFQPCQQCGRIGAHKQAVGSWFDAQRQSQRQARRCRIGRRLRHDSLEQVGHVHRTGIFQLNHLHISAGRHIDGRDDLGDALYVFRIVGDHQGIVARIGTDEIVWRHQWAQYRRQLRSVFILQHEDLGNDAVARDGRGAVDNGTRGLGIRLRNNFDHPAFLDCRIAVHPQHGKQGLIGNILGDGRLGNNAHIAGNARVDDEILAGVFADRLQHFADIDIDEVERDHVLCYGDRRRGDK